MTDPKARPPTYERRIVSVLFADLVGFTTLSEALDAEDVAAIQDRYFAAVRETVDRHGGVLEKFIGDAAMAAFGVPRTRDDDPERAVLAGIAITASVERLNALLGLAADTLAVRVGIATGEVAYAAGGTDEGRLTGDTVNTAARLQTAAPPGRVLISEATALAVADVVDLEPAALLTLKGKAETVRASIVRGVRASRSREAAMADLRAPTLGRDTELALLLTAAARVRDGHATEMWLVVAPPGTGKTRLLDELAGRLPTDIAAMTIQRARFAARDARPFGALADLAGSVVRGLAPDTAIAALLSSGLSAGRAEVVWATFRELAESDAGGVEGAGAVTGGAERPAGTEPTAAPGTGESRDARFAAWIAAFDALGAGRPAAWFIEDLHWAGPDAIAFLDLARSAAAPAGRLIIATTRPVFLETHRDWADASAASGTNVLELGTLPRSTTVALVTALVGEDVLPAQLVDRIAVASDGNCLFVEELLRLWVSAGLLARRGERWELAEGGASVSVPTTVQAVYAAQMDELTSDARQIVRRGAVSGRRVAKGWLGEVGVADPRRAVESLRAQRLFDGPVPDPQFGAAYNYRHALLRDAAYASLARADRAVLHVRFARWLETAADDPDLVVELLGDHLEAALDAAPALTREIGDGLDREAAGREAARWLERAAERAIRAGAREHAVDLFGRAVARTPAGSADALDRARRQRRFGEATADAGRMDAAVERLTVAVDLHRAIFAAGPMEAGPAFRVGFAAAGDALARVLHEQLLFERSAETAEQVLAEIGDADDVPAAWLRLRVGIARNMFSDDPADVAPAAAAAIPIAEHAGDRQLALEARMVLLATADVSPAELVANAATVAGLAHDLDRPDLEARALRIQAIGIADQAGDPTAVLDEAAAVAVRRGLDEALGWTDYLRAELGFRFGDWDAALAAGLRAVELGERHGYNRVVVRTWHAIVPILAARGESSLLTRAADWYGTHAAFFPDSPYGRLMHTAVDLQFWQAGLMDRPNTDPDRLLPSFSVDASASWLEAADVLICAWLAEESLDAAREALTGISVGPPDERIDFVRGAVAVMRGRLLLAAGDDDGAAAEARGGLVDLHAARAPWWIAKALRLRQRGGAASDAEQAEAAAIERQLGVIRRAP